MTESLIQEKPLQVEVVHLARILQAKRWDDGEHLACTTPSGLEFRVKMHQNRLIDFTVMHPKGTIKYIWASSKEEFIESLRAEVDEPRECCLCCPWFWEEEEGAWVYICACGPDP